MIQRFLAWPFFVICIFLFCLKAYAQPVSSSELISSARQYDGKIVAYEGEVIGDVAALANFVRATLSDGQKSIGVWLPKESAGIITYTGSYRQKGDWLEVSGEFHRACPQHGGDLDIHAWGVRKISCGRQLSHRVVAQKKYLAIYLGILVFVLFLLGMVKKI